MTSRENEHRDLWRKARTFEDVCELTAQWIEGKLKVYPLDCADSIANETIPLRDTLAEYNRRGFLTISSQPAKPLDDYGCGQRAYVDGYACEDLAKRIASLGLYTDLLVFIFEPGVYGGYRIPVTVDKFHPFTWVGKFTFWELDSLEKLLGAAATLWLKSVRKVIIIDLRWGREAYLWEHVHKILKEPDRSDKPYSVTPALT